MAPKKQSAADSIDKLQRCRQKFSLTGITKLLESREMKVSVSHLSRIISDKDGEQRNASDELRAALQLLASEQCN